MTNPINILVPIGGDWSEQKSKLKKKFTALMSDDLLFAEAKREEILKKLQVKLGRTKEELDAIIAGL